MCPPSTVSIQICFHCREWGSHTDRDTGRPKTSVTSSSSLRMLCPLPLRDSNCLKGTEAQSSSLEEAGPNYSSPWSPVRAHRAATLTSFLGAGSGSQWHSVLSFHFFCLLRDKFLLRLSQRTVKKCSYDVKTKRGSS